MLVKRKIRRHFYEELIAISVLLRRMGHIFVPSCFCLTLVFMLFILHFRIVLNYWHFPLYWLVKTNCSLTRWSCSYIWTCLSFFADWWTCQTCYYSWTCLTGFYKWICRSCSCSWTCQLCSYIWTCRACWLCPYIWICRTCYYNWTCRFCPVTEPVDSVPIVEIVTVAEPVDPVPVAEPGSFSWTCRTCYCSWTCRLSSYSWSCRTCYYLL